MSTFAGQGTFGAISKEAYDQLAKDQHVGVGSTRAVALPQVLPGFVVQRSTLHGAPKGWKHSTIAAKINVDPDIQGEGFTLDMSQLTADAFRQATSAADLRQAESVEDLRERASGVLRALAAATTPPTGVPTQQPATQMTETHQPQHDTRPPLSAPAQPPDHGEQAQPHTYAPSPQLGAVKAASFTQRPQQSQQPQQQRPSLFEQVTKPVPKAPARQSGRGGRAEAPTFKVTFEIKGSPVSLDTWYHDVIRDEHVLVLVYDTSCVGYPRTRLQPTDSDIAVHIDGSNSIFLVQDPSITFTFDGQEFQVLLIKETHPYAVDAQAEES